MTLRTTHPDTLADGNSKIPALFGLRNGKFFQDCRLSIRSLLGDEECLFFGDVTFFLKPVFHRFF